MNTPDRSGWSSRTQRRHRCVGEGRLGDRNETQRGSIDSPSPNASRSGIAPGARRSARITPPSSRSMISWLRVLVGEPLAGAAPRVFGGGKGREHAIVEEVRERAVADVVQEPRDPERLDDEPFRGQRLARGERGERGAQGGQQRPRPQPGLVHDAETVREPRVLGRREDPARALELADAAEALQPRRVEEVVLGGVLVGQARGCRIRRGESRLVSSR